LILSDNLRAAHPINEVVGTSGGTTPLSRTSSFNVHVHTHQQQQRSQRPSVVTAFVPDAELLGDSGWLRTKRTSSNASSAYTSTTGRTAVTPDTDVMGPPPMPSLPVYHPRKTPTTPRRKAVPQSGMFTASMDGPRPKSVAMDLGSDSSPMRALAGLYAREDGLDNAFQNSPVKLPMSRSTDAVNLFSQASLGGRSQNKRNSSDIRTLLSPHKKIDPDDSGEVDVFAWAEGEIARSEVADFSVDASLSHSVEELPSFSSLVAEVGSADTHGDLSFDSTSLRRTQSTHATDVFEFLLPGKSQVSGERDQIRRSASTGAADILHKPLDDVFQYVEPGSHKTTKSMSTIGTPSRNHSAVSPDTPRRTNSTGANTVMGSHRRTRSAGALAALGSSVGPSRIPLPSSPTPVQKQPELSMRGPRAMPPPSPVRRIIPLSYEDDFEPQTPTTVVPDDEDDDIASPTMTLNELERSPSRSPTKKRRSLVVDKENARPLFSTPTTKGHARSHTLDSLFNSSMKPLPPAPVTPARKNSTVSRSAALGDSVNSKRFTFGAPAGHAGLDEGEEVVDPRSLIVPHSPAVSTTSSSELSPVARDFMQAARDNALHRQRSQRSQRSQQIAF